MKCPSCSTLQVLGSQEGWDRLDKQLTPFAPTVVQASGRDPGTVPMLCHPPRPFQDTYSRHLHLGFLIRALVALMLLNLSKTSWNMENWHRSAS